MGERLAWHKLAHHQRRSIQEVQQSMTSMEFLEHLAFIEMSEEHPSKQDYYLAQISADIRRIGQMFAKDPKQISINDCLLKYEKSKEPDDPAKPAPPKAEQIAKSLSAKAQPVQVELGQEAMQDPKWQAVNEKARGRWGNWLGLEKLK